MYNHDIAGDIVNSARSHLRHKSVADVDYKCVANGVCYAIPMSSVTLIWTSALICSLFVCLLFWELIRNRSVQTAM